MNIITSEFAIFADDNELIEQITHLNQQYRAGTPVVSDGYFDALFAELERRHPKHPLVVGVQTALFDAKGRIKHPFPMLSTEKAYTTGEIKSWLEKVAAFTGETLAAGKTLIRISPKFDGCAARYDAHAEHKMVTRGDGQFGNDFTKLIEHGLVFKGDAQIGEVICDELYYQTTLKPQGVAHPRNFVAGLISSENLSEIGLKALSDGAVHYVSYRDWYQNITLPLHEVLARFEVIEADIIANCPYRTDGVILQVDDEALFRSMGHGSRSHYGQMAKKIAGEPVEAEITGVSWQIGRSGRYTPVINIVPTEMAGAVVANVTAHHAGNVREQGIGAGAVGLFIRSGEVIPFHQKTLKPSDNVVIPAHCHCCKTELVWHGDFLNCPNDACEGRVASQLEYLAKMLGIDLIGGKAAEKLAKAGIGCVGFLSITDAELQAASFGAGQSANILAEISRVKRAPIDDFKILASVGIHTLGRRASKQLLSEYPLDVLLSGVTVEQISALPGFADAKAGFITEGIEKNHALISFLVQFFEQITPSKLVIADNAPLKGLNVVFTGTLSSGSRNEIERNAELLGAKVQSTVNGKTSYLVCGANVGASKTNKAASLGVKVITEAEYLQMIA
ncbi:BRCT domain-containing protein [Rheinheimera sp.]|uniref:BRCT domain-containing protein n=1 Tax=Rheinheimera sp. TaxID=1869214 RepID=UPI004047E3BA